MAIDFTAGRWRTVTDVHERWWRGELERPLLHVVVGGAHDAGPVPADPYHPHWTGFYPRDFPAEAIVDRWDYRLSTQAFLGDAFPAVWPNFGPGVGAAMLGAELRTSTEAGTIWFEPLERKGPEALRFEFDPDSFWLRRIGDIMRAGAERWRGNVQIGMTDLGGNLDLLSSFRPSEALLLDLYDHPAEIRRLVWELHECWWRQFKALDAVVRPTNPGYTSWTPLLSRTPSYMLQCDFCYMIGPDMFGEFVRPELAATSARMGGRAFYHLDGEGELPHLDQLLSIPDLAGIQWVPGEGSAKDKDWTWVYRRIREAGKLAQVTFMSPDGFSRLVDALGEGGRGLYFNAGFAAADRAKAEAFCRRHGAPMG